MRNLHLHRNEIPAKARSTLMLAMASHLAQAESKPAVQIRHREQGDATWRLTIVSGANAANAVQRRDAEIGVVELALADSEAVVLVAVLPSVGCAVVTREEVGSNVIVSVCRILAAQGGSLSGEAGLFHPAAERFWREHAES